MKRGEFVWSKLANIILLLVLLVVLLAGIFLLNNYGTELWGKISDFLRFR